MLSNLLVAFFGQDETVVNRRLSLDFERMFSPKETLKYTRRASQFGHFRAPSSRATTCHL